MARNPQSTVLTPAEEVIAAAFRQRTLLPLDDVVAAIRSVPKMNEGSSLRSKLEQADGPLSAIWEVDWKTAKVIWAETRFLRAISISRS